MPISVSKLSFFIKMKQIGIRACLKRFDIIRYVPAAFLKHKDDLVISKQTAGLYNQRLELPITHRKKMGKRNQNCIGKRIQKLDANPVVLLRTLGSAKCTLLLETYVRVVNHSGKPS